MHSSNGRNDMLVRKIPLHKKITQKHGCIYSRDRSALQNEPVKNRLHRTRCNCVKLINVVIQPRETLLE